MFRQRALLQWLSQSRHGEPVHLDSVSTIADGIQVKEPGEHTFEYVKKYVDDIVTVSDDEISSAILKLIESAEDDCRGRRRSSSWLL